MKSIIPSGREAEGKNGQIPLLSRREEARLNNVCEATTVRADAVLRIQFNRFL
jgi:hypothetical protein